MAQPKNLDDWYKKRKELEANLLYKTMRQKKPSKKFHDEIGKICKGLDLCTMKIAELKSQSNTALYTLKTQPERK